MKEGKRPVREVSTDSIQVGSWEAWAPAPRSPPQEQIQKSGSIFPTHKLKVGATQQGRPVQKKKKKPFLPRPQDVQARCDFSAEARDSPETAQISAAHAFPVDSTLLDIGGGGPAGEHEDQEGAGFGQRGAWRKCRSWGPRTGTL